MTALRGKRAVVVGASSGVGKATVLALLSEGVHVTAVARRAAGLRALEAEAQGGKVQGGKVQGGLQGGGLVTLAGDAAEPALGERVLAEVRPDIVVLALGITPRMGPVDTLEWAAFSEAWNVDLQASFHFTKQALRLPLAPGSSVIIVSSGAAVGGSPLAGGYPGAKRMQWWLAIDAQRVSDARKLGIRVLAVLPRQLIEGTAIAKAASTAYGELNGMSAEAYMKRFDVPLDAEKVAAAIVTAAGGGVAAGVNAIAVTGVGFEPIA